MVGIRISGKCGGAVRGGDFPLGGVIEGLVVQWLCVDGLLFHRASGG